MLDCSWKAVLFDLDGTASCLSGDLLSDRVEEATALLRSIGDFGVVRVLAGSGVSARSQDERLRVLSEIAGERPTLFLNLHYPDIRKETIERALGLAPVMSVVSKKMKVHRFFADGDAAGNFEIPDKWTFDKAAGQWKCGDRVVRGREDFPQVHMLSDALAAGTATELQCQWAEKEFRVIELTEDEAFRLTTPLDVLRRKVG